MRKSKVYFLLIILWDYYSGLRGWSFWALKLSDQLPTEQFLGRKHTPQYFIGVLVPRLELGDSICLAEDHHKTDVIVLLESCRSGYF